MDYVINWAALFDFTIRTAIAMALYALCTWPVAAWKVRQEKKHKDELIEQFKKTEARWIEFKKSVDKYNETNKRDRWNIRMLRQEVVELVKAKGGKF